MGRAQCRTWKGRWRRQWRRQWWAGLQTVTKRNGGTDCPRQKSTLSFFSLSFLLLQILPSLPNPSSASSSSSTSTFCSLLVSFCASSSFLFFLFFSFLPASTSEQNWTDLSAQESNRYEFSFLFGLVSVYLFLFHFYFVSFFEIGSETVQGGLKLHSQNGHWTSDAPISTFLSAGVHTNSIICNAWIEPLASCMLSKHSVLWTTSKPHPLF